MDHIEQIIAYENCSLSPADVIELFQGLIDDGTAWQLQGSYGAMAHSLIENGHCTTAKGDTE